MNQTNANLSSHQERDSFSKASHFAFALLPVLIGIMYGFFVATSYHNPVAELTQGFMRTVLAQDQNLLFKCFIFGYFLFCVGSAVGLMRIIEKIEEADKNFKK